MSFCRCFPLICVIVVPCFLSLYMSWLTQLLSSFLHCDCHDYWGWSWIFAIDFPVVVGIIVTSHLPVLLMTFLWLVAFSHFVIMVAAFLPFPPWFPRFPHHSGQCFACYFPVVVAAFSCHIYHEFPIIVPLFCFRFPHSGNHSCLHCLLATFPNGCGYDFLIVVAIVVIAVSLFMLPWISIFGFHHFCGWLLHLVVAFSVLVAFVLTIVFTLLFSSFLQQLCFLDSCCGHCFPTVFAVFLHCFCHGFPIMTAIAVEIACQSW